MSIARRVSIGSACLLIIGGIAQGDQPAGAASAAKAPAPREVSIPFANSNIWNWQVIDNQTVLIESNSHKWYKARLLSPCLDLPFAEKIGFESNADGSFDRFSSIVARAQTCPVTSLTQTSAPQKKAVKKATAATPPAD